MKIDITDIWRCIQEDGKQIEDDWNCIVNKVKSGHAEEISEGDTLFLGACTKGSTAIASYRTQPFSVVKAKQRAFCFKISYVKHIYETMKARKANRTEQDRFLPKDSSMTLEQRVHSLFKPFLGMTSKQIEVALGIQSNAKSRFAVFTRTILGYSEKHKSFYEFDAANIQIKTIRVERNGKPKEDMSFKNIKFNDIVYQEWEDCDLYQELISKFIFVIYRITPDGNDYYLDKVKIWNMPESDLDAAKEVWEKMRQRVVRKEYDNLRKYLFSKGLRYRKNYGKLPGHPDIALPKYKTVIFVNGCFWHGHAGCRFFHLPSSNVEFWELKIRNNRERDIKKTEELDALGWTVITIWECEIKRKEERMITLEKLYQDITNRAQINPHQL